MSVEFGVWRVEFYIVVFMNKAYSRRIENHDDHSTLHSSHSTLKSESSNNKEKRYAF